MKWKILKIEKLYACEKNLYPTNIRLVDTRRYWWVLVYFKMPTEQINVSEDGPYLYLMKYFLLWFPLLPPKVVAFHEKKKSTQVLPLLLEGEWYLKAPFYWTETLEFLNSWWGWRLEQEKCFYKISFIFW